MATSVKWLKLHDFLSSFPRLLDVFIFDYTSWFLTLEEELVRAGMHAGKLTTQENESGGCPWERFPGQIPLNCHQPRMLISKVKRNG